MAIGEGDEGLAEGRTGVVDPSEKPVGFTSSTEFNAGYFTQKMSLLLSMFTVTWRTSDDIFTVTIMSVY